jgi:tetratricopeptide (TPR) repeat protein
MTKFNQLKSAISLTRIFLGLFLTTGINSASTTLAFAQSENLESLLQDYKITQAKLKAASKSNWNWDWLAPGNRLDAYYCRNKNWQEAEKIRQEHLLVLKQVFGENNLNVASAMESLAETKLEIAHFGEAKELLEKALILKNKESNYGCSATNNIREGLAHIAMHDGNLNKAEALLTENYNKAVQEEKNKPRVIFLPSALINLAQLYENRKQNKKAAQLYERLMSMNMNAHAYPTAIRGLESYLNLLKESGLVGDSSKIKRKIRELKATISQLNKSGLDY